MILASRTNNSCPSMYQPNASGTFTFDGLAAPCRRCSSRPAYGWLQIDVLALASLSPLFHGTTALPLIPLGWHKCLVEQLLYLSYVSLQLSIAAIPQTYDRGCRFFNLALGTLPKQCRLCSFSPGLSVFILPGSLQYPPDWIRFFLGYAVLVLSLSYLCSSNELIQRQ